MLHLLQWSFSCWDICLWNIYHLYRQSWAASGDRQSGWSCSPWRDTCAPDIIRKYLWQWVLTDHSHCFSAAWSDSAACCILCLSICRAAGLWRWWEEIRSYIWDYIRTLQTISFSIQREPIRLPRSILSLYPCWSLSYWCRLLMYLRNISRFCLGKKSGEVRVERCSRKIRPRLLQAEGLNGSMCLNASECYW